MHSNSISIAVHRRYENIYIEADKNRLGFRIITEITPTNHSPCMVSVSRLANHIET